MPPPFGPSWVWSRTLTQGVELLVSPLLKSLFCPINASPNEFLVPIPPNPPHLKSTSLMEVGRGEVQSCPPPPFWGGSKIMNRLGFFDFEPKKCFWVPTLWGLYGVAGHER